MFIFYNNMITKYLFKLTGLTILIWTIVFLLQTAVYALPNERIETHLSQSAEVFEAEGTYPLLMDGYNSQLDNWTDSVMLLTASYKNGDSVIRQAAQNIYPRENGVDPTDTLIKYDNDKEYTEFSYSRYWNGYIIWLRLLLVFMNYQKIRMLIMSIQILLFVLALKVLYDKNRKLCIPLSLLFIFFNPVATMISMQFSTVVNLLFLTIIIMLRWWDYFEKQWNFILLFWIVGVLTNIFDFFTFPLITLGVPLIIYLCTIKWTTEKGSGTIAVKGSGTVAWFVGYGLTWTAKWVLATLVTGKNVIINALGQVHYRSSNQGETGTINFADVIAENMKSGYNPIIVLCLIIMATIFMFRLIKFKRINNKEKGFILMIGTYPLIWEIVIKNHEYIHHWFTFRNLGILVFALFTFMMVCMPGASMDEE